MSANSSGYYSHLDTMKKKAVMEDAETRGEKLEKKGKVADDLPSSRSPS
jgi:hypothetical protein